MNRSFKVLVVTLLALSLSMGFGSALAKRENKPTKPPKAAVETIVLSLVNPSGVTMTPDAKGVFTVVTGQKYAVKSTVTPAAAKNLLRWHSSKSSVANVDSRGNVFCVKPGSATITAASKSGAVKQSIVLDVKANMTAFTTTADKSVQKIYLKGKYLYIDVVLVNSMDETLETAPDLKFSLKLAGESVYTPLGVKSGHIRRAIAAKATGTASYKVEKVNPKTIWLLDASATCEMP